MNRDTPLLLTRHLDNGLRAFTPGFVVKEGWRSLVVHFHDVGVLDVDKVIALYHEGKGGALIVQNYRVLNRKEMMTQGGVQLKVRPVGKPRPFDQRRSRRISSDHAMIVAELGGESDCCVVDVGEESLAIIARSGHSVGDVLDLGIDIGFTELVATVTVCRVTEDGPDRSRYGVACEDMFQECVMRQFNKRLKRLLQFSLGRGSTPSKSSTRQSEAPILGDVGDLDELAGLTPDCPGGEPESSSVAHQASVQDRRP